MTTGLFSIEPPANASHGYVNLYSAATDEHRKIREHCEYLWKLYKPYADKNFLPEFVLLVSRVSPIPSSEATD
jgi:hypothetical protein